MSETVFDRIRIAYEEKRAFFDKEGYRSLKERLNDLKRLKNVIKKYEDDIIQALKADFNKPFFESYGTEIGLVYKEIDYLRNNLKGWLRPKKVPTSIIHFPSTSRTQYSPLGVVLVISPWNYPFLLSMMPLVDALAAGNCVILKPAQETSHCAKVMSKIISETFSNEKVSALLLEREYVIPDLILKYRMDHIFFTGSEEVGKLIMQAASRDLVPVTLELGGKTPCVIDINVNLDIAAKRIAWGKFVNAGQTCVAPDYILVPPELKEEFIEKCASFFDQMLGENPSETYANIIDTIHYERLNKLLNNARIRYGGQTNSKNLSITPTIVDEVGLDNPLMTEEIFGPILPVLTYESREELMSIIAKNKNPLAFYVFSKNRKRINWYLENLKFGGASVNNCLVHLGSTNIPFGGVGQSGFGRYHGKFGFETFSHIKGIMKTATWFDLPIKYGPYTRGKLSFLKKIMK